MSEKRSPFRLFIRTTLSLVAIVGMGCSVYYSLRLGHLRRQHAQLRSQVGVLDVKDPSKVAIARVPFSLDAIPPGLTAAHVWRYRMYLPPNYGPCYHTKRGRITADSPRGSGGGGSSWSSPKKEPIDVVATMALIQSEGQWMFCRTTDGGSSTSTLPSDFQIKSLDDLVVETVASVGDETHVYDTDEAICLFRLREKTFAKKRNGKPEKDLYRGFVVYAYSAAHRDAFKAWSDGSAESMKEAAQ